MEQLPATISLQYFEPGDDAPTAGYEITKQEIDLPPGAQLPRVGEFFEYSHWRSSDDLEVIQCIVLAVNTRLSLFDEMPGKVGWKTIITLGPIDLLDDKRLTLIAV